MSKIQYRHIDFDGASLIQRRHKRQVVPPGMFAITNMYSSRSDGVPTLRPDYETDGDLIYAISDAAVLQESGSVPDIINTVTGIYGSTRLLYLTSYIPWTTVDGVPSVAMTSFSTGTCTAADNSMTVAFTALGANLDLQQESWRGALLEIDGDGHYYVVDRVIASDPDPVAGSSTGTIQLVAPTVHAYTAKTFELFYNHNCYRAAFNKADICQNGAYLIYGTPGISTQISAEDISGPFYGSVTEDEWIYGGVPHVHYGDRFTDPTGIALGADHTHQYLLATNGVKWAYILYQTDPGSTPKLADYHYTSNINSDGSWVQVDGGEVFYGYPRSAVRDSTLGIVVADSIATAESAGITDSNYISWNDDTALPDDNWTHREIKDAGDDPLYPSPYLVQSMVSDGSVMTAVMWNPADDSVKLVYASAPGYGTWADCTTDNSFTGTESTKIKLVDSNFVVCGGLGSIYISSDGIDFAELDVHADVGTMDNIVDIAYNNNDGGSKSFVLVSSTGHVANCATVGGTYADRTPTLPPTRTSMPFYFVFYDQRAKKMLIATDYDLLTSADYGATWTFTPLSSYGMDNKWSGSNFDFSGVDIANHYDGTQSDAQGFQWLVLSRNYVTTFEAKDIQPVSKLYRSNSVSVLDGYTVLVGTREFTANPAGGSWTYHPRRVRWSVAGSPVDFASEGADSGDLRGNGALLRSVAVNGRIVIFETVAVGALVPRGDSTDPWDYDIIDDNFSFLSNPVVAGGQCYIVGADGLLYSTDGISPMSELGSSFDLTEFDDFDDSKPVWLVYSTEFDSLMCYYRDVSSTTHMVQVINISNGGVSEFGIPHFDDSDDELSEVPGSIVAAEGLPSGKTYVSYGPNSGDTKHCQLAYLLTGEAASGTDTINNRTSSDQDGKWYATFETGELYITQEGEKSSVKHLIIESYTSSDTSNEDTPYLVAEVKSIEDSDFATSGDTTGTATLSTTALTGVGTAWSNTIVTGTAAAGEIGPYTLPCIATQARIYVDTTLLVEDTDYTTSGKTITLTTDLGNGEVLYAYWENVPEVKVKVGDFFKSTEGWHRVTAVNTSTDIDCDHYLSTGTETVTHYPAWQLDDGHGRIEIGINRLVEGVQIRLYIIPDYGGISMSTVAKITGLSIGYVPQGRKLVKATGS